MRDDKSFCRQYLWVGDLNQCIWLIKQIHLGADVGMLSFWLSCVMPHCCQISGQINLPVIFSVCRNSFFSHALIQCLLNHVKNEALKIKDIAMQALQLSCHSPNTKDSIQHFMNIYRMDVTSCKMTYRIRCKFVHKIINFRSWCALNISSKWSIIYFCALNCRVQKEEKNCNMIFWPSCLLVYSKTPPPPKKK